MTFYVMAPTFDQAWNTGVKPLMDNQISRDRGVRARSPIRSAPSCCAMCATRISTCSPTSPASAARPLPTETVDLRILVPAFMISEIRRGFEIGFLIVLPFLVIDLIVATITMAMGMMMLPPTVVSLPFKILFFVLIDGWNLLVGSLVRSFT